MFLNGLRKGKPFADNQEVVVRSAEETKAWGERLAESLPPGTIVCLYGELGAGKTTLVKGLVRKAAGIPEEEVRSPTFTYLHVYEGPMPVYHFDLYRLSNADEFLAMGFDEYFTQGGICCVEWPERIASVLPFPHLEVRLKHLDQETRQLWIRYASCV